MPINHQIAASNGAPLGYHKPLQTIIYHEANTAVVLISSYFSEQAALDGLPIAQQWQADIDPALLAGDQPTIGGEVEHALTTDPKSPLYGGVVVLNRALSLDELKTRKRAEITRDRIAADADHFVYGGKAIRTADKDITDLLIADARWRKGPPANWPGGWKAVDDSYVLIRNIEEWDAFFCAMYDTGIGNFRHSQELKARLEQAATTEDVAAITW